MIDSTKLPHPSDDRSWIEIDRAAIAKNFQAFQTIVGDDVSVMPVVKSNGYGHGASEVADVALTVGASRLAVATCAEAEELRAAGFAVPVHILGAMLPAEAVRAVMGNCVLSIVDIETARLASQTAATHNRTATLHLKIDTGMGRLGILPAEAAAVAREIKALPKVVLEGVFTHFSEASDDAYSARQVATFDQACAAIQAAGIDIPLKHASNSAGTICQPAAHYNLVRVGAGLYGFHSPTELAEQLPLAPALSWRCVIVQLRDLPSGVNLGYGRTFKTKRPSRIAILPVGYADGYLRAFSNVATVLVNGKRAPVVGIVSMDYTLVDVTDVATVAVGDDVTLIGAAGDDRITLEELADCAGTIPYGITTNLGTRPARVYSGAASE